MNIFSFKLLDPRKHVFNNANDNFVLTILIATEWVMSSLSAINFANLL